MAANAQFPQYGVFQTTGEIWLTKPDKKAVKAKQKDLLYAADKIELRDDNSEVHLVNTDSNLVVIKKKGIYKVSEIQARPVEKPTGAVRRYAHLWVEEWRQADAKPAAFTKSSFAGSWGGARRGSTVCNLFMLPDDGQRISADTVSFVWKQDKPGSSYHFTLSAGKQKNLMDLIVRDTMVTVIVKNFDRLEGMIYNWSVMATDQSCTSKPQNHFFLITKDTESSEIAAIVKTVSCNDPLGCGLKKADALAFRGYLEEAGKYLTIALQQ